MFTWWEIYVGTIFSMYWTLIDIQWIRKVFRPLNLFHILLRYSLTIKLIEFVSSLIYTQGPIMTKQKQVFRNVCKFIFKKKTEIPYLHKYSDPLTSCKIKLLLFIFSCISFACHEFMMSVTHHTLTTNTKTSMHFNASLWGFFFWGGGTIFNCKSHCYSIKHICWQNGFRFSKVWGIKQSCQICRIYRLITLAVISPD